MRDKLLVFVFKINILAKSNILRKWREKFAIFLFHYFLFCCVIMSENESNEFSEDGEEVSVMKECNP